MLQKRYSLLDYAAVGCMTFGLFLFTLGDYALNLKMHPIGKKNRNNLNNTLVCTF